MAEELDPGNPLPTSEDILRAVTSDIYDGTRLSSQVFKGAGTSVSREAMYSVRKHWEIFRRPGGVEKPPRRRLLRIGQVNIERLQAIALSHDVPLELSVTYEPLPWNDAHAVIPQKISRGLANKLKETLTLHEEPSR